MEFTIKAKGHPNVKSEHKSTFEITKDPELTPRGDCIIGVDIDKSMSEFPQEFKDKIRNENTKIIVQLKTENGFDEIIGYGHKDLTLTHQADIVCRKSDYTCSRTLMINSNKASCDLDRNLINDLKNSKEMDVKIILK